MNPLKRELFQPYPNAPHSRVRVSDGEITVEMDIVANSLPEEELRYLFDMYRELGVEEPKEA